ncbi:MAG: NADH-quinone oxidoreductase subunit A [Micropruina sp.]|uniref:NADH-quinone oxidoreductase subunit A n=1 Tax=Micropruina sp. TaxID=2737536 RepID=UPI0039E29428
MSPYIPILGIMALAAAFLVVSVVASLLVGPRRYNRAKYDTYECGIDATPAAVGGGRFPVKYYITAMMFLVFDVEVAFLYPWAVAFDNLGVFGFGAMMIFLVVLGVAYFYEIRRGGLEWD